MKKQAIELHTHSNKHLWILGVICVILFLILFFGLAYRQIILNKSYLHQEHIQSLRRIIQPGPRGNIYDRNKNLLVGNQARFSLVLYLSELREEFKKEYISRVKELRRENSQISRTQIRREARIAVTQKYLDQVNQILGKQAIAHSFKIENHFQQRLLLPLVLIENLNLEDLAKLTEQLPVYSPLQIHTDSIRYYPYDSTAAHTLGYVASNQEAPDKSLSKENLATFYFQGKSGKNGLEKSFDDHLQGINGEEIWRVDPSGFQCQLIEQKLPVKGKDLITSIDLHLQRIAEKAMGHMRGAVVAIEVKTGEILAMVSKPDYNLSDFSPKISKATYDKINKEGAWLNRATQGIYPPGSPFKIITSIAAFRAGLIDENTSCICPGYLQVGNRKFPCLKRSGHGQINLTRALALSCNVIFFEQALATGISSFSDEIKRFGFGKPTGIELPFESQITLVPTPEWKKKRKLGSWLGGDTANMSIGQGYLLVTPLQVACFIGAFANKKTILKPTLIHNPTPPIESSFSQSLDISPAHYQKIVEGLEAAVQQGTARRAGVNGVRVASKTGTAQVKIKNGAMDVVWCVAFAPIEDPTIAIAVLVEEATEDDNFWGSITASPIAGAVLNAYFKQK